METSLYLVELYRRRDYGDPATSLLLKGLQLVCRFRFMFLEKQSQFHFLNVRLAEAPTVRSIASRIVAEIDILTSDSFQANLQQPSSWTTFVDTDALVKMSEVWNPLKARLMSSCAAAMSASDDQIATIRQQLTDVLKDIQAQCGPQNELLLRAMATKLTEYAKIEA
jgi:hypothetical protein